ncbi:hypothetical protein ACLKA7_012023 [Drosophila subpalustris]
MTTSVCSTIKTANTRIRATTSQTAKPLTPLSARRRPQILKSSLPLLLPAVVLMCQLQQFAGGGGGYALAMTVPASESAPAPASSSGPLSSLSTSPLRALNRTRRVQKRHGGSYISFKERFHLELNSSVLDWSNGCGGNWTGPLAEEPLVRPQKRCAKHKKLLRNLQNKTGRELRQLKAENKLRHPVNSIMAPDTSANQAIDISQRNRWKVQSGQYNFLPRLNVSATPNLPLRRVHHDLQFYVAAFSYLRHAQLHFDYEFLRKQSVLSSELARYRTSARNILCFVEEAINATNILYAPSQKHSKHRGGKMQLLGRIKTVPRLPMEKRLMRFKTPLVELHKQALLAASDKPAAMPREPHQLDALFLKYQYIQYLKQMTQLLARQRKRNCISTSHSTKKAPKSPRIKFPQRRPKGT